MMNERIRELAVETGWSEDIRYAPRAKEIEKFAELIVRECVEQLNISNVPATVSAGLNLGKMAIKQHFGVT